MCKVKNEGYSRKEGQEGLRILTCGRDWKGMWEKGQKEINL
jgi:hypothetical protein